MRERPSILTDGIRLDGEYRHLFSHLSEVAHLDGTLLPILVSGLSDGASDAFLVSFLEDLRKDGRFSHLGNTSLLIAPEEKALHRLEDLFTAFGIRAALYPARDLHFDHGASSHEYEYERIRVLYGLLSGACDIVLSTPDAALSFTIPPERLIDATVKLDFSSVIDPTKLASDLIASGYARVEMIEHPGQFAMRGSIIDVYAPNATFTYGDRSFSDTRPLRIELFGDEIDRMVLFDPESQRAVEHIDTAALPPSREVLLDGEKRALLEKTVAAQMKRAKREEAVAALALEAGALKSSAECTFLDRYLSLVYPEKTCLLDYFTGRTPLLLTGTLAIYERIEASEFRWNETIKELAAEKTVPAKYLEYSKRKADFDLFSERALTIHVDSLGQGMSGRKLGGLFGFRSKHTVSYFDHLPLLIEDLSDYLSSRYRVVLMAENESAAESLSELLKDKGFSVLLDRGRTESLSLSDLQGGKVLVTSQSAIRGYDLPVSHLAFLSTASEHREGALRTGKKRTGGKKKGKDAILSYADLRVGDFVVHEIYGIGRFEGIETMTVSGVTRDYVNISYAGTDKLFLPVDKLDRVSKYIGAGADSGAVRLSKMGGGDWVRTKTRAKAAVKEMAKELIHLYATRMRLPGFAFPPEDDFERSFDAAFEYEETEGQLEAIQDIKADMEKPVPMDRLLCGDVGYGKTEVALRAAYKAILGGKQVAFLVPTTILALQHYQTALSRMRGFAVNVDMVSRFRTPKEQAKTLRRLERGELDLIIGTHRLISKDVHFHDLGLLIVDEEQRFGVAQKEKLKQLCGNVDVLTLTATPIPRTLNMAMGGIRDISVLDEAPGERFPVQTYVLPHEDTVIMEAVRRELRRGGQVFWLHNVVETINETAAHIASAIPDAHITVAHGQMDKDQLEEIWSDMLSGKVDILVCTTIIETGVDITNANTLIVENAHRLGLSQLHQIRGRVGRSSRRAYAYFTYPKNRALSEVSEKRLSAIREYAEFGAGFKIALRDLEIRGAGDMLGAEQHGHLDAVGYDLFIKLLNRAVLEERGIPSAEEKPECTVTVEVDAYLPESYIPYSAQRMNFYKRIALIETEEDRDDVLDEMVDRYGDPPKSAENLLYVALIRASAVKCGMTAIVAEGREIRFTVKDFDPSAWQELALSSPENRIRLLPGGDLSTVLLQMREKGELLSLIYKMLRKYLEIVQK